MVSANLCAHATEWNVVSSHIKLNWKIETVPYVLCVIYGFGTVSCDIRESFALLCATDDSFIRSVHLCAAFIHCNSVAYNKKPVQSVAWCILKAFTFSPRISVFSYSFALVLLTIFSIRTLCSFFLYSFLLQLDVHHFYFISLYPREERIRQQDEALAHSPKCQ